MGFHRQVVTFILCWLLFSAGGPLPVMAQTEGASQINGESLESLREQAKSIKISDELKDYLTNPTSYVSFNLSDNDREALRLLGYSEDEIDSLSFNKDELQFQSR